MFPLEHQAKITYAMLNPNCSLIQHRFAKLVENTLIGDTDVILQLITEASGCKLN